jgi:ASC-1-like (ASCH) protein
MHHEMSLYEIPFERIKKGKKDIEVRLYDEKRKKVQLGDTITFAKLPERQEEVTVEVIGLFRFKSFRDLFKTFDKSRFGHPTDYTIENQVNGMRDAYSEEEEKKYGVLGIYIKLLDTINLTA